MDCFVLFVFKVGDIRTHFLSDENSLGRRKRKRNRSSREGKSQKTTFHEKKKRMESKPLGKELTSDILSALSQCHKRRWW